MHDAASHDLHAPAIPGLGRLHHFAVAVSSVDDSLPLYQKLYGGSIVVRAELPQQGVDAVALAVGDGPEIELIAPLDAESSVQRFLDRRGSGLHHVAYEVESVEAALEALREHGIRLIDEVPRTGLHGTPVAFVHPSSLFGVLTELVQSGNKE